MRERAVMISSTMPSTKYSCSGSPLRLTNGSTAINGLSGSANSGGRGSAGISGARAAGFASRASPTKRTPFAGEGADQGLRRAAVADRAPRRSDPAVECRIGDDPPAPHRRQQIVFADDALAVLQQVDEEVEDLRLHSDLLAAAAQLAMRGVEHMVAEQKPQSGPPAGSPVVLE